MRIDNKNQFKLIFELSTTQKWIVTKQEALYHLLFSECDTDDKRKLIVELLGRFTHITNEKYSELTQKLVSNIISINGISDETTQVVAMAADSGSDSSQRVLYDLKLIFEQMNWREYKHVNQFGSAYRTYKSSPKHKNIVLIDEFIGSGRSAIGRVNSIKEQFSNAKIEDYKIYVRTLIAMQDGIKALIDAGIDVQALVLLEKGITDYSPKDQIADQIDLMRLLEKNLSQAYNDREMPSLGYGETESLYTRDGGNTPNNVFPIFWWPFFSDGTCRQVLLHRAMRDA
ncbi:phosphoribosyltransferase-like protein [Pseudomonas peli]|uniref:phosphoribosyltransferase-like protein n=1 Tax=Pseudomonas peli TaxID=592361 RepID=UPI003D31E6DF